MELQELLLAREVRANYQKSLLQSYGSPLVCLTLNIPGPVKYNELVKNAFLLAERKLKAQFPQMLHAEHKLLPTGCEGYYVIPGDSREIKDICMTLEAEPPMGRLLDLDVLSPGGEKLSRSHPRSCLLCGEDARVCRRRGSHPIEALAQEAFKLLQQAVDHDLCHEVSRLAVQGLLYELLTTPKPGLVDMENRGSHRDMDPFTFSASASALAPFFYKCCKVGCESRGTPSAALLPKLRYLGKEAESSMYRATEGINTHKGAIFTLGLLSAAAGRLADLSPSEALCREGAKIVEGITERELQPLTAKTAHTKGELLYLSHRITGIRGQAERGFPTILNIGLPVLQEGLRRGYDLHRSGAAALLSMLKEEADTALISRSSPERYQALQQELTALLQEEPYPTTETLRNLDRQFISEQLSPGGSADLLAATYFLYAGENSGKQQLER